MSNSTAPPAGSSSAMFNALLASLQSSITTFQAGGFSASAVITLVKQAMSYVETNVAFASASGEQCKDCVVSVVTRIVNDVLANPQIGGKLPAEAVSAIQLALTMAPSIIDAAVGYAKARIAAGSSAVAADAGVAKSGCFCA